MKQLKIGDIKLKNGLFLSPMVDVTDLVYRMLCRKAGAAMAYTEMLYIDAILHENEKTKKLMKTLKEDKPIGLQITGNSEKEFEKLIPYLKPFDLVDINCGCPSIKLVGNQAGSFLLNRPDKIGRMIEILKTSGKSVTAKVRLGFKENNVIEIAKKIEKAGADALTVHARLAIHGRSVPADWKWIKKVKENIGIPVIGNGDVFNGKQAAEMLDIADGVMIARGAIGDPLIFKRVLKYLRTGKEENIDYEKNVLLFDEYLKLVKKYDVIDIGRMKYIGTSFIRGFEGASKFRNDFMKLKTYEEIRKFMKNVKEEI